MAFQSRVHRFPLLTVSAQRPHNWLRSFAVRTPAITRFNKRLEHAALHREIYRCCLHCRAWLSSDPTECNARVHFVFLLIFYWSALNRFLKILLLNCHFCQLNFAIALISWLVLFFIRMRVLLAKIFGVVSSWSVEKTLITEILYVYYICGRGIWFLCTYMQRASKI